jgi:hypothetical protein
MRLGRRVAITAAALLASGGLAPVVTAHADQPADLYVHSSGCSDAGAGTSAQPFCTIQAAANIVSPGQTVVIEPGVYTGPIVVSRSGTASAPITFQASAPKNGLLAPNNNFVINEPATTSAALTVSNVHDVRIVGLTVEHNGGDGIDVTGSSNVTLDMDSSMLAFTGSKTSDDIAIDGTSSNVTVSRSYIRSSDGAGVRVAAGATQVTVADDIMAGNQDADVAATGVSGLAVTGNTVFAGNCAPAFSISGGSTATVENNAVKGLFPSGATCAAAPLVSVGADTTGGVKSAYNAWSVPAPRFDYAWGGTDFTTAADLAAAVPGEGDHDLEVPAGDVTPAPAEGSPLIDSADAQAPGATSTDFFANPRSDDPNAPNTGTGSGFMDRGAVEREDTLALTPAYNPSSAVGTAPFTFAVTPNAGDSWGVPLTTTVDFGDGSGSQSVSGGQVSHVYATPGSYIATTTTADPDGYAVSKAQVVQVGTADAPNVTLTATVVQPGATMLTQDTASFSISAGADSGELKTAEFYPGDGSAQAIPLTGTSYSYTHPGTYTAEVVTTDVLGRTATASTTVTVGDEFAPLAPVRDFDSRSGGIDSVPAHGTVTLSLSQLNASYAYVDAVGLTVTVTDTKAAGFLTVYPHGTARPNASTLNFTAGQTVPNAALAQVGQGSVDFYNGSSGPVDLVVDTFGFEAGQGQSGGGIYDTYSAVGPVRVLDTRDGTGAAKAPVAGHRSVTLTVGGDNGVPSDAEAVVLNVATTDTKSSGFLTAYGDGSSQPGTSDSNWTAGQTVSNLVVVPVSDGKVVLANGGGGTVDFVADLVGYYHHYGTAAVILPVQPTRILDTRTGAGTGGHIAKLGAGQSVTLKVAGLNTIPSSGAVAAELNLTVTNDAGAGWVSAYPGGGTSVPSASSLNFRSGQTVANAAVTPIGPDGTIVLHNGSGAPVDLIVDLSGFYYGYSG